MNYTAGVITEVSKMPLDYLVLLLGFSAIGLAALAIWTIYSIAKKRHDR